MTTANGTYTDCGPGKSFSLTIDCFGSGCSGLQTFPGLTCTNSSDSLSVHCNNNVVCDSPANFTSAFTLKGDNSTANVTENVKTFGSEFLFTEDSEGNATYVNQTSSNPTPKSGASISLPRVRSKFIIVFFAFMATCISSGFAQSTPVQSLQAALPPFFGSILQAAEAQICQAAAGFAEGGAIQFTDPPVAAALAQLKKICEDALWEIEISTGVAEAALSVPLGAGILALGLGDIVACNKLITDIFLPAEGPVNNAICSAVLSHTTTSTTSTTQSLSTVSTSPQSLTMISEPPSTSGPEPTGAANNCPTTIGALGPSDCGPLPGVNNHADCAFQGFLSLYFATTTYPDEPLPCADMIGWVCSGTTAPDAAYWCSQCQSGNVDSIPASCYKIYFNIGNVAGCGGFACAAES